MRLSPPFVLVLICIAVPGIFIGCMFQSGEDRLPSFGHSFALNFGLSEILEDGSRAEFSDLIGESRCPDGALCTWPGEAKILVTIGSDSHPAESSVVRIGGYITSVSSTGHDTTDIGPYRVVLLQLDPYPQIDTAEPKQHYVARLSVVKK